MKVSLIPFFAPDVIHPGTSRPIFPFFLNYQLTFLPATPPQYTRSATNTEKLRIEMNFRIMTYRAALLQSVWLAVIIITVSGCILEGTHYETEPAVQPPESFLLSWQSDPTTTMTIDWYPIPGTEASLAYRTRGEEQWQSVSGLTVPVPGIDRSFQRTELGDLQPDQRYEFRFDGSDSIYQFRTMPDRLTRPIRFVAAGDMLHRVGWMRNTAQSVMRIDSEGELDFAVIGGDLAYADGEARKVGRWFDYFRIWTEEMITSDNRVIPHVAAIGNHEIKRGYIYNYLPHEHQHPDFVRNEAPYFSTFIPFPGSDAYDVLDFGDYLSLFLLDSGHASFIKGDQTDWLRRAMYERGHVRHLIPVYHVPAWPSARDFDDFLGSEVRNYWVPLFEKYGVRVAFENHDHAYKRTHPIREGEIDESGIHYIGDGAWGVSTRQIHTDEDDNRPWYLAEADTLRHFIMGEIDGDIIRLNMYDEDARPIDEVIITAGFSSP